MNDPVRPSPIGRLLDLLRKLRLPVPGRGRPDPHRERLRVQVGLIREALKETGVAGAPPGGGSVRPRDDADVHYLYRPGHALVRDGEDFERLRGYFDDDERRKRFRGQMSRVAEPTRGLVLVSLPSRMDGADDVLRTLEEIDREMGEGMVTPDHVFYVCILGRYCPATEPEAPAARKGLAPWPPPVASSNATSATERIRVSVVDTGLWTAAVGSPRSPWLVSGDVLADPSDEEIVDPLDIHPYAGHGTFVAGVISCLAPDTRIEVEGALPHGGATYESDIVTQLSEALDESDHPQLISISAGSHTRLSFAPLAFEMLASAYGLDDGEETLVVAAAGNDSSDEPFWPAAFPWVVAVGSVDSGGGVSDFSNVGPWVDVYARGRDLVNAFPKGTYTCHEPPNVGEIRTFDGLAQWSGTSFSTPIVTGLIAARMRETGRAAREAWQDVLATATPHTDPRGGAIKVVGPLT